MLFTSSTFLFAFLPLLLAAYHAAPHRFRNSILLVASLLFYAWGQPSGLVLLPLSIAVNYGVGRSIDRAHSEGRSALGPLRLGIGFTLAFLGIAKYTFFALDNLNWLLGSLGIAEIRLRPFELMLGVSFFTFHAISYLVDIYWRRASAQRSIVDYGLYIALFPQLIAGPIIRYRDIAEQLVAARRVTTSVLTEGIGIFLIGLAKKLLLANVLAVYADQAFSADARHLSSSAAWLGVACYTGQIYFDFSGYSDMAIGLSRLFGIRLPLNFDSPYKSRNIIEFWRRWHMTLSRFLRDYLYIPLGGNRHGGVRRYANLMITMLLGGLWHGAGWNFAIWGGLHGLYLAINHAWQHLRGETRARGPWARAASVALTFAAVNVAWVFFRAPDFGTGRDILLGMFGAYGLAVPEAFAAQVPQLRSLLEGAGIQVFLGGGRQFMMTYAWIAFAAALAFCAPNTQQLTARFRPALNAVKVPPATAWLRLRLNWQWATALGLLGAATLLSLSRPTEFLYFQF